MLRQRDMEEHHEIPVEGQPEEQQQPATAEVHETEVLQQQQEKGESRKKPITTNPRAIRLATISNLLEKQTTQMNKIAQMVQPLQKQLNLVGTRTEFIKQIPSQLKQLQKEMSQSQKESQKIRSLLSKKTFTTKKNTSTKKKGAKKK